MESARMLGFGVLLLAGGAAGLALGLSWWRLPAGIMVGVVIEMVVSWRARRTTDLRKTLEARAHETTAEAAKRMVETGNEWREEAARLRGRLNAIRAELEMEGDAKPASSPHETPAEVLAIRAIMKGG